MDYIQMAWQESSKWHSVLRICEEYDIIPSAMSKYRQGIVDTILARKLDSMGAVLVEGQRFLRKGQDILA